MKKYAIGADIGGSHISAALIDMEREVILPDTYVSRKVNNGASASEILETWAAVLDTVIPHIDQKQLAGTGFAMPGPFDYKNGVALFKGVAKYEHLYAVEVAQQLKELLAATEAFPLHFINDAVAFGVGEAWIGKAATYQKSISITLGTGFGSAFIDEGLPVVAGERLPKGGYFGMLPYQDSIADDYFSTRWFIKRYAELSGREAQGVQEIAQEALHDKNIQQIFDEFGQGLALFLGPWIKSFAAEALVIGGNISKAYPLFGPDFEQALAQQDIVMAIHISQLMETAAILGSARLLDKEFNQKMRPLLGEM
jgi:glucokinase